MLQTSVLAALLTSAAYAAVAPDFISGWNLPSNNADGSCKSPADWAADFAVINGQFKQQFAAGNTGVKVFNSAQCDTAANIVQPAIDANIKIALGVWAAEAGGAFEREKDALRPVLNKYNCGWLSAVVVGSEDLYRKEISPERLAEQIKDISYLVKNYGDKCSIIPMAHADTRSEWVRPKNAVVIDAVDVIFNNAFPYWASIEPHQAGAYMKSALDSVRKVSNGKPVWIGETGYPTGGKNFGGAIPSTDALRTTWRLTKCPQNGGPLWGVNTFWFAAFDQPTREDGVERHFGVANADRTLKISLSCP